MWKQKALLTILERAIAVAESINNILPAHALAVPGDILSDDYIVNLVQKAADFGNGKIHIIVNNAGFTWDGVINKVSRSLLFALCYHYVSESSS